MELTAEQLVGLNKIIAEAMGWTNLKPEYSGRDGTISDYYGDGPETQRNCYVPDYSRDPAQIGPMLEHFRKQWATANRPLYWGICSTEKGYTVWIEDTNSSTWGKLSDAPTLELAICLCLRDYLKGQGG